MPRWAVKNKRIQNVYTESLRIGSLGSEVAVTATAADLNLIAGMAAGATRVMKFDKVALTAAAGNGGALAWANPEGATIIITKVIVNVTTVATGACTLDIGTAANGTTSNDTLLDGLDVNAAIGLFDNVTNKGTNGLPTKLLTSSQFVTATVASGTVTGLVGQVYIGYILL